MLLSVLFAATVLFGCLLAIPWIVAGTSLLVDSHRAAYLRGCVFVSSLAGYAVLPLLARIGK